MAAFSLRSRTAFAVLIGAAVTLGAGCTPRSDEVKASATEPVASEATLKAAEGSLTTYKAVEAFDMRARAEQIVNGNQGKVPSSAGYERIMTGVVADPENPTRVYFATSAYDAATGTNFVGIYGFDTKSLNWWRLYKNTYKQKDSVAPALLRVVAHDGERLFVVEDRVGASYSAGTIAKDVGRILAFDFAHPEEGLFPLPEPPDDVANLPL